MITGEEANGASRASSETVETFNFKIYATFT